MYGLLAVIRCALNFILLNTLGLLIGWSWFAITTRIPEWWGLELVFGVPGIALLLTLFNAFRLPNETTSISLLMVRLIALMTGCATLGVFTLFYGDLFFDGLLSGFSIFSFV